MAESKTKRVLKKYSQTAMLKIVRAVCSNYETGEYTLESCCDNAGVPIRTWQNWWAEYESRGKNPEVKVSCLAEVASLWKETQDIVSTKSKGELRKACENQMLRLVNGWEYKETHTDVKTKKDADGQEILVPVGQKIITKTVLPNAGMIQFALKTVAPEIYGDRSTSTNLNVNVDAGDGKARSLADIQAEIDDLLKSDES